MKLKKKYGRSAQTIMEDQLFESIVGAIFTTFEPQISETNQLLLLNGSSGFNNLSNIYFKCI